MKLFLFIILYSLLFFFVISTANYCQANKEQNNCQDNDIIMSFSKNVVKGIKQLHGGPMTTPDPFLFCVYHKDEYPAGNDKMEVPGRIGNGMDFDQSAPYRMYHGTKIPGFPEHPHRGFETITATIDGIIDHSDSLGNGGRYGEGDLQWMTAGSGVVHGEMFPLIFNDKPNPTRFFQIWLNLPQKRKLCDPDFKMHWADEVVKYESSSFAATVWAGILSLEVDDKVLNISAKKTPPKNSWATDANNEVTVSHLTLKKDGLLIINPCTSGKEINRNLYFIEGSSATINGQKVDRKSIATLIEIESDSKLKIESKQGCEFLLLQGRPIKEPVAQHGPFVMNTQKEIQEAFADYRRTKFGGWPWDKSEMVFPREKGRFSLQNGTETTPKNNNIL